MNPQDAVDIARRAMMITLLLASPMLGFGLLVGLIIRVNFTLLDKTLLNIFSNRQE